MKNKMSILLGLALLGLTFGALAKNATIEAKSPTDEHLVHQVENFLSSNPKISTKLVKIQIDSGIIYISGLVESEKDSTALKQGLEKETHATSVDTSNLEIMELEERGKK